MTKYQKLINWIDKNLTWLNCEDVVVRIKYEKNRNDVISFNLSQDGIKKLKGELERIKNSSSKWGKDDNKFDNILAGLNYYLYKNCYSYSDKIDYQKIKKFMEFYQNNIKSYSALRKVLEKLLSYDKKEKSENFKKEGIHEFINWVRYQEGRKNWLLNNRCCYLSELIESIWEETSNYKYLKTWLQAIVANYVYFKWTKN